jgi:protein-disulfide isomerase
MVKQAPSHNTPRWRLAFDITSTVLMLALAAALVWQGRGHFYAAPRVVPPPIPVQQPVPKDPIAIGESNVRGATSAHVAIIEFADFACSGCAAFATTVEPALLREYVDTGRVVFVFKNFPLQIHPEARAAARAVWCAAKHGRFWQAHDRLFEVWKQSQTIDLHGMARDVGLDPSLYRACLAGTEADQHVQTERDQGEALHVSGTPTFFVGTVTPDGRVRVTDAILGSRSLQGFREILDRVLNR